MTLQATARLIEPIGITYTTRTEDFRKRLTALCASKKPTQEMMTITPAMAGIMLERNRENNRPIVKAAVAQYARAIKEGRWTAWDKHERVFLPHRVAWCIDSFNATRQNREIKQFKVVPGREFPKVGK